MQWFSDRSNGVDLKCDINLLILQHVLLTYLAWVGLRILFLYGFLLFPHLWFLCRMEVLERTSTRTLLSVTKDDLQNWVVEQLKFLSLPIFSGNPSFLFWKLFFCLVLKWLLFLFSYCYCLHAVSKISLRLFFSWTFFLVNGDRL